MEQVEDEIQVKVSVELEKQETIIEELFRTYYITLCNYACYFLKDEDDAKDIVQGIFYQLWEKGKSVENSDSVKFYLFTAVKNNSLKRLNHIKIRNKYKENIKNNVEMNRYSVDQSDAKELEKQIREAVESLSDQCRLVFKLSRQGGLKYTQIAEHLNISPKTVENHMGKALRVLKEKLKNYL